MMPRAVFEELGGFDEDFFVSHEDVDLSYRARLRGYRCRYVPDAVVRHHGSATLGPVSAFAVFHGQRNLEWVFVKNTPGPLLMRTLPGHLLYDAAAAVHFARIGRLGAFLRAKGAALVKLPAMLRKRSAVQRSTLVDAAAIESRLDRGWLAAKMREKRFDVGLAEQAP
jgi:GT2 family glycosyltransferase